MFLMDMDILPIQGSSVPCERVFSSGKQTTTDRRSRITPELMEALQMLKFGLKHDVSALNFTRQYDKNVQTAALEALMEDKTVVPVEINEFVRSLDAFEEVIDVE